MKRLKIHYSGLYFNPSKISLHRGSDPVRKSQFTSKMFFDDKKVSNLVMWAFSHTKLTPASGRVAFELECVDEKGGKVIIGKEGKNLQNEAKCPYVRLTFKYLPQESTKEVETWVNTSVYPAAVARNPKGKIKFKTAS